MDIVSTARKHFKIKGHQCHSTSWLASLLAALGGPMSFVVSGSLNPIRALAVGPNLVTHQLCSALFVAGFEPDSYYREVISPSLGVFKSW